MHWTKFDTTLQYAALRITLIKRITSPRPTSGGVIMFDKASLSKIRQIGSTFDLNGRALAAVAWVESAGTPYWNIQGQPLPAIRWEGHYFWKRLKGDQLKQAVREGLASPKAGGVKNPNNWEARYKLLSRAMDINKEAALESISMGLGQVMGANWRALGYTSVTAMWETAKSGIDGQVELMARFIDSNKLAPALNGCQWATFAKAYNGQNYKVNAYDKKMAEAYAKIPEDGTASSMEQAIKASAAPSEDSKWVQTSLKTLGYYHGEIDGRLGPASNLSIRLFQRENGLEDDGIPGTITREAITKALTAKAKTSTVSKLPQTVGALAGTGSIITTMTGTFTQATEAGTSARAMLDNIGVSGIVVSLLVAAVTGFAIWYAIKNLREKSEG